MFRKLSLLLISILISPVNVHQWLNLPSIILHRDKDYRDQSRSMCCKVANIAGMGNAEQDLGYLKDRIDETFASNGMLLTV